MNCCAAEVGAWIPACYGLSISALDATQMRKRLRGAQVAGGGAVGAVLLLLPSVQQPSHPGASVGAGVTARNRDRPRRLARRAPRCLLNIRAKATHRALRLNRWSLVAYTMTKDQY